MSSGVYERPKYPRPPRYTQLQAEEVLKDLIDSKLVNIYHRVQPESYPNRFVLLDHKDTPDLIKHLTGDE